MDHDLGPATATAAQNTASNNGGNLDAWMLGYTTVDVEAPSEDFIRIFKRMTLAEPRESTSTHAQYLTGPMTVSEGGRGPG